MEEVKKKVLSIIDQFRYEEVGNKLSQFSIQMLRLMVEQAFNEAISKEKPNDSTKL